MRSHVTSNPDLYLTGASLVKLMQDANERARFCTCPGNDHSSAFRVACENTDSWASACFTKSIGKTHLPTNLTVNLRGCRRQEQVGVTGSGHVDAAQPGEGKDRGGSCGDSRQRGQEAWPRSEAHCVQVLVLSGGLCVTRHPGGTGLAEGSSMERSWTRAAAPRHSHLL